VSVCVCVCWCCFGHFVVVHACVTRLPYRLLADALVVRGTVESLTLGGCEIGARGHKRSDAVFFHFAVCFDLTVVGMATRLSQMLRGWPYWLNLL